MTVSLQVALTVAQSRNGSREFSHVSRRQFLLEQRVVEAYRGCQLDLHQVPQQHPTQPTNQSTRWTCIKSLSSNPHNQPINQSTPWTCIKSLSSNPHNPHNQPINALDVHQVPQQHAVIVAEPAHQHPIDSAGSLGWPLPMLN